MSIWDRLFNTTPSRQARTRDRAHHRFGRYTDAHKEKENYAAWDRALDTFEDGHFLDSLEDFLTYLRDENEDNVKWQRQNGTLYFECYQGSKRVTGEADDQHLRASARIAKLEAHDLDLLRRLTAMNYELKYSRFALDGEECLTIVFDTPVHDASPHKLYSALKELALRADKQDDLLLGEFNVLSPVEITHLEAIPEAEKNVKLEFLRTRIDGVTDYLAGHPDISHEQPAAVAYLLLDLVYRLDYLLTPEGHTMEALERMHRMYFARELDQPVHHKNERLQAELRELRDRAGDEFGQELYRGKSTFGITVPANHRRLATLIDNELPNMDWYEDNGYPEVALAIPGYVAGYALFNFAPPAADRELLHLYFRIVENDYFHRLEDAPELIRKGKLQRRAIRSEIDAVARRHGFKIATSTLSFDNLTDFSRDYLRLLSERSS